MTAIAADIGVTEDHANPLVRIFRKAGRTAARNSRRFSRLAGVVMLDAIALFAAMSTAAACANSASTAQIVQSPAFQMLFGITSLTMFSVMHLYRRCWRFLSFGDCIYLSTAVTIGVGMAWSLSALVMPPVWTHRMALVPVVIVQWSLLLVVMCSMRVMRRGIREHQRSRATMALAVKSAQRRRALLLGELDWARAMIELIRADSSSDLDVVGVLTPNGEDRSLQVSGVPILGAPDMLPNIMTLLTRRGRRPTCIVMRDRGEALERRSFLDLVALTDKFNLTIARAQDPWMQMAGGSPRVNLEYLSMADLLGRPEIKMEASSISQLITGRKILVTGAGGTIGGELVRQLASFAPSDIVLLDHGEYNLYAIDMEVREKFPDVRFHVALCSIRQNMSLRSVFAEHRPEIVFHAAALKHVPLVEANPCPGVHTNVIGTRNVADAACEFGVRAMVQVSTDKAVNPVGMMGATKRLGELYCQARDIAGQGNDASPRFMTVRFGNVLGSSGSLVPLFKRQLSQGQALTVTHPEIERYFMTVEEAVQLILQSSARAMEEGCERGTIFVLDMGDPVKIVDIARRMIRLAGLEPDRDVAIRFVGLRPGEKLFEELFDVSEQQVQSRVPGVFEARPVAMPLAALTTAIAELERLVLAGDTDAVRRITHSLIQLPGSAAELSDHELPILVPSATLSLSPTKPDQATLVPLGADVPAHMVLHSA